MPPRIGPVESPDEEQSALLGKTLAGPDGQPLNIFRTLAHRPELMKRINALGGYFMAHGGIEVRERELVILRTAAHAHSAYEIGQHRWIGAAAGLSADEIGAAGDAASTHEWSPSDRILLDFADELLRTDSVSGVTWERLGANFDELQRLELLALVGFYRLLAGILNGLGVELDRSVAELLRSDERVGD